MLHSSGSHHRNTYYKGFKAGLIQHTFRLHRLLCDVVVVIVIIIVVLDVVY